MELSSSVVSSLPSFLPRCLISKCIVAPKLTEMTGVLARWLTRLPSASYKSEWNLMCSSPLMSAVSLSEDM